MNVNEFTRVARTFFECKCVYNTVYSEYISVSMNVAEFTRIGRSNFIIRCFMSEFIKVATSIYKDD